MGLDFGAGLVFQVFRVPLLYDLAIEGCPFAAGGCYKQWLV